MYMLVAGTHPFYVKGDTVASYKAKLVNPQFVFPSGFPE